jgi:hypothetical protein
MNQRVFQGESMSQGGPIDYYLIERNYPTDGYGYAK